MKKSDVNLKSLREELTTLTTIDAPSGFEEPVLEKMRDLLTPFTDQCELDVRGNLYATKKGSDSDGLRVMLTAHADEIGFMVIRITESGFLRFTKLGGPTDMVLPGQRVRVLAPSGPVEGLIGVKPGHVLGPDAGRSVPPVGEMYVDVGAETADQASAWGIEPGTPIVFAGPLAETKNERRVIGKCIDDRAGLVALLETARQLHRQSLEHTIIYTITVEEEIGRRGAEVAAKKLMPDVVIALDTVPSGGTPDLQGDELPWEIGRGPLIKVLEMNELVTHRPLRELFRKVAEENDLPYQLIVDTAGLTDATKAQQASGDIAAIVLGIPRRYAHSAVEMLDLRDLARLIELLVLAIPCLGSRDALLRLPSRT